MRMIKLNGEEICCNFFSVTLVYNKPYPDYFRQSTTERRRLDKVNRMREREEENELCCSW